MSDSPIKTQDAVIGLAKQIGVLQDTIASLEQRAVDAEAPIAAAKATQEAATAALNAAVEALNAPLVRAMSADVAATKERMDAIVAERDSLTAAQDARLDAAVTANREKIAELQAQMDEGEATRTELDAQTEAANLELRTAADATKAEFTRIGTTFDTQIQALKSELTTQLEAIKLAASSGINPRGPWDSAVTYNRGDLVSLAGSSYVSLVDNNTEKPGKKARNWMVCALRGTASGGGGTAAEGSGTTIDPASQVEVAAGTVANKYVSPETLAGAGFGDVSAATVFGATDRIIVSDGVSKGVKSVPVTIDAEGSISLIGTEAGSLTLADAQATPAFVTLTAPANIGTSYALVLPDDKPTGSQVLAMNAGGTQLLGVTLAAAGMTNPMTTQGDIIVGGASGAPGRLAIGSDANMELRVNAAGTALEYHSQRYYFPISFNPKTVCDATIDRLFLKRVPSEYNGLVITAWNASFDADPATEAAFKLKRADAFIGVANAEDIDVCDTTAGVSSEATPANINAGATIASGKVIYIEFTTPYTVDLLQIHFQFTYYWV